MKIQIFDADGNDVTERLNREQQLKTQRERQEHRERDLAPEQIMPGHALHYPYDRPGERLDPTARIERYRAWIRMRLREDSYFRRSVQTLADKQKRAGSLTLDFQNGQHIYESTIRALLTHLRTMLARYPLVKIDRS